MISISSQNDAVLYRYELYDVYFRCLGCGKYFKCHATCNLDQAIKEHTCRCDGCATNMKCYPEEVTFREFISGIL